MSKLTEIVLNGHLIETDNNKLYHDFKIFFFFLHVQRFEALCRLILGSMEAQSEPRVSRVFLPL